MASVLIPKRIDLIVEAVKNPVNLGRFVYRESVQCRVHRDNLFVVVSASTPKPTTNIAELVEKPVASRVLATTEPVFAQRVRPIAVEPVLI